MTKPAVVAAIMILLLVASGCGEHKPFIAQSSPPPQPRPQQYSIQTEPSPKPASASVQRSATEQDLGVSFYPKATVGKSGIVEGPKGAVAGAVLQTREPYAAVVKYYRDKYQAQKPTVKEISEAGGAATMLNWQNQRGNYTIVIRRDDAAKQTTITLVKTSK